MAGDSQREGKNTMKYLNKIICLYPMYFVYRILRPFFKPGNPWDSKKPFSYQQFVFRSNDIAVTLGFLFWLALANVVLLIHLLSQH